MTHNVKTDQPLPRRMVKGKHYRHCERNSTPLGDLSPSDNPCVQCVADDDLKLCTALSTYDGGCGAGYYVEER